MSATDLLVQTTYSFIQDHTISCILGGRSYTAVRDSLYHTSEKSWKLCELEKVGYTWTHALPKNPTNFQNHT